MSFLQSEMQELSVQPAGMLISTATGEGQMLYNVLGLGC